MLEGLQMLGHSYLSFLNFWSIVYGLGGALYAVWIAAGETGPWLALASSRDGGATWSAPRAVHEPADCAAEPAPPAPVEHEVAPADPA